MGREPSWQFRPCGGRRERRHRHGNGAGDINYALLTLPPPPAPVTGGKGGVGRKRGEGRIAGLWNRSVPGVQEAGKGSLTTHDSGRIELAEDSRASRTALLKALFAGVPHFSGRRRGVVSLKEKIPFHFFPSLSPFSSPSLKPHLSLSNLPFSHIYIPNVYS